MPTKDDKPFKTDSQISGLTSSKINQKRQDLEEWIPEDNNNGGKDDTGLFLNASDSSIGWSANDMFKTNEQNYGVQSTFKSNLEGYTVQLQTDKTSEGYRSMEAKAAAKAQEIEQSKTAFKTINQIDHKGDNNNLTIMDSTANFVDETSTFLDER